MRTLLILLLSALSLTAMAQNALPNTDIYLAYLNYTNGKFTVSDTENITHRPGYDNQPSFLPNLQGLAYVSYRKNAKIILYEYGRVKDLELYDSISGTDVYSPAVIPFNHNNGYRKNAYTYDYNWSENNLQTKYLFSVVRVEKDSTQRIWIVGEDKPLIPGVKRVGYYCWINEGHIALNILEDTLKIYEMERKRLSTIDTKTGRCIKMIWGHNAISYVKKLSDNDWRIYKYDMMTQKSSEIVTTFPGSEDFDWGPDETLFMGNAGKLYAWTEKSGKWIEVADFTGTPLENFYRIAIEPKYGHRIALVSYIGKKP